MNNVCKMRILLIMLMLLPVMGWVSCSARTEPKQEINKLETARQLWSKAYDKIDSSIQGYIPIKEANELAQPFIDKADSISLYLTETEIEKLKEYKTMRFNRAVDLKLESKK